MTDKGQVSQDTGAENTTPPKRKWLAYALAGIVALAACGGIGWLLLQDKPQPMTAKAAVTPPGVSPIVNEQVRPQPVSFRFRLDPPVEGRKYIAVPENLSSVARIDLIGKRVNSLVVMTPFHAGDWEWVGEDLLVFTPAEDWPAGEEFSMRLAPELFAPHVALKDSTVKFTTAPFAGSIEDFRFYQDPVERSVRKAVGKLTFTHPVKPVDLERAITLGMRPDGATVLDDAEPVGFRVEYSPTRREAWVHSDPIQLPEKQNYIHIEIDEDLTAEKGPAKLGSPLSAQAVVPDVASFFRVEDFGARIVRNEEGEPEQALMFDFTDRVNTEAFQQRVSVWLLPEDHILENRTHQNYYWRSPREVTDEVLVRAERLNVIPNPTEDEFADLQSFRLDAPERRYIYVKVESGLTSENGFVMSKPYDNVLRLPEYPREVKIARDGGLLPMTGSRKVTFVSRGLKALKVEVGRIVPGQVNHLVSQTRGDMSSPHFSNYNFDEDNITERFEKVLPLAAPHAKKATYSHVDLDEFIASGERRGMFFVTVHGWDPDRRMTDGGSDRRFILITDLGLLEKQNADGSREIFVQSLSQRAPVAGARLELLGVNGLPVVDARTDNQGHAHLPDVSDFRREKQPSVYIVRQGDDLSFMPFNAHSRQLDLSKFDTGGEYTNMRQDASERLRAFLFSERGIYRPGDMVHLGAIVARDDWHSLAGVPVELNITDPRGNTVAQRRLNLSDDGVFTHDMPSQPVSPTGDYHAQLYLLSERGHRERQIGSVGFKIEEFQPDTMRIRARIPGGVGKAWIKPGRITADVKLENLFGMPAQDRRVVTHYSITPASLYFAEYRGYRFEDPLRTSSRHRSGTGGEAEETRSDAEGNAEVSVELGAYDSGIYRLRLDIQGFEPGDGRSVRAETGVMISPLDHVLGWKADGELGWLKRKSERNIDFIALGQDGKPVKLEGLNLRLIERRYVSTLVKQRDGTYAYQSTRKDEVRKEERFTVGPEGLTRKLPTDQPGEYVLEVSDANGLALAAIHFNVMGAANLAAKLEKNAELDLKLEGKDFASGDEIRMQVTAPYTGTGLITIERDKVYAWKWFRTDTESSMQSIHVPEGIEGNAYVHVAFVRDMNSPEVFVSPLSYAVAPFSVDRSARTVSIDLEAPEKVIPGEDLVIRYTASKSSRIAVFAVDEGILQVADYRAPDPLSFFFRKKALQVSTRQILDLVMPEYELIRQTAAAGGGDEAAAELGANLNPFRRKTEAPVVYWAGLVQAGPEQQQLVYKVPDYFNGRLRIIAVGAGRGAVGAAENTTIVRGPFVLTPNVLTATAPGDEFEVTLGVANALEGSGDDAKVNVEVTPSKHLEIIGEKRVTLAIAEGSESKTTFRVRALDAPGSAELKFTASGGDVAVSRTATLSVRPAVAYEATTQAGVHDGKHYELALARDIRPEFAEQSAAASASPLVLADGMANYLEHFPHGCAEQMVSKVFPYVGLLDAQLFPVDRNAFRDAFDYTIRQLRSRQNADGGFRFWPTPSESAEFPSVYIAHFLTDAREQGMAVPDDMLKGALEYLRRVAERPADSLYNARMRAYAIYVLTRNGTVTTNFITNLHENLEKDHPKVWKQDLAAAYMAATYQMLKHAELAEQLVDEYDLVPNDGEWFADFDTRLGRDSQYVYLLARHFPERAQALSGERLQALTNPIFKGRYNTLSASYAVLGLGAYTAAQRNDRALGKVSISGKAAADRNGDEKAVAMNSQGTELARAELPVTVKKAVFDADVADKLFYIVSQAGFDTDVPKTAISEGLEIQREYLDANGKPVTAANIGDEITVRLRMRSTGDYRSNIAVVDLLPGGFEVILDSVRDEFDGWRMDYRDVREDRVVIYGGFGGSVTEIRYRAKVTAAGKFVIPPATAQSMYDRTVRARTAGGAFEVRRP